jgi:hypothetical protein
VDDEEARGVLGGAADTVALVEIGGGVDGQADGDGVRVAPSSLLAWAASRTSSEIRIYSAVM